MKKIYFKSLLFAILLTICLLCTSCGKENKDQQNENNQETELEDNGEKVGLNTTLSSYTINPQMYLKIDGLEGDATDAAHNRWFELVDLKNTSGNDLDSTNLDGLFVFTYEINSSTPKIQKNASIGYICQGMKLEVCKPVAGRLKTFYTVDFEKARFLKAEVKTITDNNGAIKLVQEVTVSCEKQTWTYTKLNEDSTEGPTTQESFTKYN